MRGGAHTETIQDGESRGLNDRVYPILCRHSDNTGKKIYYVFHYLVNFHAK